jgi:hypothetical protein
LEEKASLTSLAGRRKDTYKSGGVDERFDVKGNRRDNMSEADMKCKVAILLLLYQAYRSALQAALFLIARSRKLAAETPFCDEFSENG